MTKTTITDVIKERQEYIDALRLKGDSYALGFLVANFLYPEGGSRIKPLTSYQHQTMAKWKEESAQ